MCNTCASSMSVHKARSPNNRPVQCWKDISVDGRPSVDEMLGINERRNVNRATGAHQVKKQP